MQTTHRFFDDLARVAGGATSVAAGIKDEVEGRVRQRLERILDDMDLVDRDSFEAVKAMAAEARAENQRLAKRIAALEAKLDAAKPKPSKPKPAAKK